VEGESVCELFGESSNRRDDLEAVAITIESSERSMVFDGESRVRFDVVALLVRSRTVDSSTAVDVLPLDGLALRRDEVRRDRDEVAEEIVARCAASGVFLPVER